MLDKIFNKKKKDEDIFCIPQRKTTVDIKNLSKLGPKALQQIVQQQQKYITILTTRIQQISTQYRKIKQKSDQLQQKNDVINTQFHKMSNQHQQLTIKFDNLQNSLEFMIANNQQQLNAQLNFLKGQQSTFSGQQMIPKTIDQVFSIYQDRFALCSKISNQNKFLKQKINDIELKFDEIKQRYQQAQKQKGFNSMIPQLMQSLQELKRQRKNSNSLPLNTVSVSQGYIVDVSTLDLGKKFKQEETMTSQQKIQSPKGKNAKDQQKQLVLKECSSCVQLKSQISQLKSSIKQFESKIQSFQSQIQTLKQVKQSLISEVGEWSQTCKNMHNLLSSEKVQKEQHVSKLSLQIKLLKQQLTRTQQLTKKQQQQNNKLKTQSSQLSNKIQTLSQQNSYLHKQIEQKSIQLTIKQAQLGKLSLLKISQSSQQTLQVAAKKQQQVQSEETNTQQLQSQQKQQQQQKDNSQQITKLSSQQITLYQQKITHLISQNQQKIQQISQLKQQLITKSSQINKLIQTINKQQKQFTKNKQQLQQSQKLIHQTQQKYQQLMQQNQYQMLQKINSLQTKIKQTDKQLIYLRNNRQTIESDNKKIMKQKKILEQALKQLQMYKTDVETRILPSVRQQLQALKKQHQRICEQKEIIQQHNLQSMNSLNVGNQQLLKQLEIFKKDKTDLQNKLSEINKQNTMRKSQTQTFTQTINKLNKQTTEKLLIIEQLNTQLKKKSNQLEQLYQQLKSKQRKYQSQLNQQRIKAQTMKRTITIQETKLQQNEKSSNKLYEQSMHKDKKMSFMEVKLKEYKHLIQSLKKQKDELQKMFVQKMKGYQQDTIQQVLSQQQLSTDRKRSQDKKQTSKSDGALVQVHTSDKDTDYFKNQILSYEQSNMVLKQQNSNLRDKIKQLEDELGERQKQVENMQQKRQQTLRQIEKLNIRSINGTLKPMSKEFTEKQKQFTKQKSQLQADKQKSQLRMKKIAMKAYKGFDILLKKHQSLYKDFIDVFVKELADRQQVKNIQSEINSLINKSTDMKDVFQDYI